MRLSLVSQTQRFTGLGLIALALGACTSAFRPIVPKIATPTTYAPPEETTETFVIKALVVDPNVSAPQTLTILGDDSNTLGSLCHAQSTNGVVASPCTCTLYYGNQRVDVPITYIEQNLLRCSYAGLDPTLLSFNLAVHFTPADTYSNQLTFNLSSQGLSIDSADIKQYQNPKRFQCRDIVTIPYMFDPNVYDPFQSDPNQSTTAAHLTYPLNFYTTNVGLSVQAYVDGFANNPSLANWDCPSIFHPTSQLVGELFPGSSSPTSPLASYLTANSMNLVVYSQAALPNGDQLIFPTKTGSPNRHTFFLAKPSSTGSSPGGVFTMPVNSFIAPNINSSTLSITSFANKPIGYGAPPIQKGAGIEDCSYSSTSVPLPTGFKWAKLWLFRSSLPQRNSQVSTTLRNVVQSVTCNPGDYTDTSTGTSIVVPSFAGCYRQNANVTVAERNNRFYSIGMSDVNTSGVYLADRYLGSYNCVRLKNPVAGACAVGNGTYPGASCSSTGSDIWEIQLPYKVNPTFYANAVQAGCGTAPGGTAVRDPLGLCSAPGQPYANDSGSGAANTGQGIVPVVTDTSDIITTNLDSGGSRFDYLFVVSPPEVNTSDMTSGNSVANRYKPMRFKIASDCIMENPSDPSCKTEHLLNYQLKVTDVGSTSDTPAPNKPANFPVCVLQPI